MTPHAMTCRASVYRRTSAQHHVAADAKHASAEAALLRMRIEEKRNTLVKRDDVNALIDSMVGLLLTHLSGFPARCGGHDLSVRRSHRGAAHELRREISKPRRQWRISATNGRWMISRERPCRQHRR